MRRAPRQCYPGCDRFRRNDSSWSRNRVQKKHVGRLELRRHLLQPQLVEELEDAPIGLFRMKKRRRYAGVGDFAPVRLHTTRAPEPSRTSASRLVTVVFPLVPTTMIEPRVSFPRRFASKRGCQRGARVLPGKFAAGLREHVFQTPRRNGAYGLKLRQI